jgi:predicted nucleic acid-binding protein
MAVVDASVVVAVYKTDDLFHGDSRAWFARYLASTEAIDVPYLILSELAGAIARPTHDAALGHAAVAQFQLVPRLTLHQIGRNTSILAAQLAADRWLRGADALYAAVAVQRRLPLITWDRELHDRAAAVVRTFYPNEV